MRDVYKRWFESDCINQFSGKSAENFFRSETALFKKISEPVSDILDIGCASGRLIEYLDTCLDNYRYTGIDIVPDQIKAARANYPQHRFDTGNALEMDWDERFDLVNATGVMQHEPAHEELLELMWKLCNRYVICDVKFADISKPIVDISKSYCGSAENRLYYILLGIENFLETVSALSELKAVSLLGYPTPLNNRTFVPDHVKQVYSCGVMLEKQLGYSGEPEVKVDILGLKHRFERDSA